MSTVSDHTLALVNRNIEQLAEALNKAKYPVTQSSAGALIALGVAHLREIGVPEAEIFTLLISFFPKR
jgi:uncharacterized protein YbjT (DUF2867 family)